MGISIDNLEDNSNFLSISWLSDRETMSGSFRELSAEELKISGGQTGETGGTGETEENSILVIDNAGNNSGLTVYGEDLDVYLPRPSIYGDNLNIYGHNVNVYRGRLPNSVSGGNTTSNSGNNNSAR